MLGLVAFAFTVGLSLFRADPDVADLRAQRASGLRCALRAADDSAEVHGRLAYWLQSFHTDNAPKIEKRRARFRDAAIALGAQIVLLAVALGVTLIAMATSTAPRPVPKAPPPPPAPPPGVGIPENRGA